MPLQVEIVTAESVIYSEGGVDEVVAPGIEGELAVLPRHAAFITILEAGEMRIMRSGAEEVMAITGGFLEVRNDRVVVLADAAERADEIDIERAEAARRKAEETLREKAELADLAQTQAALMRALARLRVAEKRGRRGRGGAPRPGG
jgi:F-type H+-transporting ATPase subunit epsilon